MPRSKNEKGDIRAMIREYRSAIEAGMEARAGTIAEAIEFGRYPREGKHFVRSARFGGLVEEADGTPFTSSVSSEAYWCG